MDVTFSGATTAHVLADRQRGAPPQIDALDGSEALVTVTIGGNDVGYIPLLMAASLPRVARRLPLLGRTIGNCWTARRVIEPWPRSSTRCARSVARCASAPPTPGSSSSTT